MRALVIEDEKEIVDGIKTIVAQDGYETDAAYDGYEGLEYIRSNVYDVVLLDVMLPGINGFDILKKVRDEGIDVPIILLTAKSMTLDKIKGLNLGANDYLTKPFDAGELLARMRARVRDRYSDSIDQKKIKAFDLTLDPSNYRLAAKERAIELSHKEYLLMEYLMVNKRIVLTRTAIIFKVWGFDDSANYNNVDVYVSFLRKKLKFIGAKAAIVTKKGVAYSLEETDD